MKISGLVIQERNIIESNSKTFTAKYKGKLIYITSIHGLGKPQYEHLTRFNIDVKDIKTGMLDVQSYEDCHEIRDAIRKALEGACLL